MIINLIGAFVNAARAVEVASVANLNLILIFPDMREEPDEAMLIMEEDKELLVNAFKSDMKKQSNGCIYVELDRPSLKELTGTSETMKDIGNRVTAARMITTDPGPCENSAAFNLLKHAYERCNLSIEDLYNIDKAATAIAKLSMSKTIMIEHIAEAIQYQTPSQKAKKLGREYAAKILK